MNGMRNESVFHLAGINLNIVLWEWWLCGLRLMLPEYFEPVAVENLPAHERILRKVEHFVKSELKKPELNVMKLAEYLGMHPNYINSVFKAETGMTIGSYIRKCRLEMAAELLQNTSESLCNIATECGFSQQTYFSRIFRQEFGMTPFSFRNSSKPD